MFRKTILAGAATLAVVAGAVVTAAPAAATSYGFYFNSGPTYRAYPTYRPYRSYAYHPYRKYAYRHHHRDYARADVCGFVWSPHRGFNIWVCR
jgi:hypothetical protein